MTEIGELARRFALANAEQKVILLSDILQYGESGIDFAIATLEDPELTVRVQAYQILKDIQSEKARQAVSKGVLFNPGDRVYIVYKSEVWFDDEKYHIFDSLDENHCEFSGEDDNIHEYEPDEYYEEQSWVIYYDDEEFEDDSCDYYEFEDKALKHKGLYYACKTEADEIAESIHQQIIKEKSFGYGDFVWKREIHILI
jgi:hypothetical protein